MRLTFQNVVFCLPKKSIFRHYCIQNVKDGIQIQVYNINKESVNHFSQFISVKGKTNLSKSKAQLQEKLRKLRLRQNDDFLIKKRVCTTPPPLATSINFRIVMVAIDLEPLFLFP